MPYYIGDLKGDLKEDPNLENYPYSTLIETLMDPFKAPKRDP